MLSAGAGSGSGTGNIGMCGMSDGIPYNAHSIEEWLHVIYHALSSHFFPTHTYNIYIMHQMSMCTCTDAVEIGFVLGSYRVNESELDVMVCVEVKSGVLTPAESASVTVNTSPGTAMGNIIYPLIYTHTISHHLRF